MKQLFLDWVPLAELVEIYQSLSMIAPGIRV